MMMTAQAWWVVALIAVALAGVIGFFAGRQWSGTKKRMEELESELSSQKEAMAEYRREVDSHFDKTATLFVSMAGSYKDLFEHLSSGYRKLSADSERDLFKDRVAALLLDGTRNGASRKDAVGGETGASEKMGDAGEHAGEHAADERGAGERKANNAAEDDTDVHRPDDAEDSGGDEAARRAASGATPGQETAAGPAEAGRKTEAGHETGSAQARSFIRESASGEEDEARRETTSEPESTAERQAELRRETAPGREAASDPESEAGQGSEAGQEMTPEREAMPKREAPPGRHEVGDEVAPERSDDEARKPDEESERPGSAGRH